MTEPPYVRRYLGQSLRAGRQADDRAITQAVQWLRDCGSKAG